VPWAEWGKLALRSLLTPPFSGVVLVESDGISVDADCLGRGDSVIDPSLNDVYNLQLADAMYHDRQSSYDLFASGPFRLFGREHQLVLGTSRYQEKYLYNGASYRILANDIDLSNWDPSSISKTRSARDNDRQAIDINQKGCYSTVRFKLTDPLTLILGGRLDWYDYSSNYYWSNGTPGHASYKVTRNVTKYAGLVYDLNEQYSVYASYTDIFKPQNYRAADSSLIEPVVGKNYEVGLKGAWFEGLLNGTLAVYRMNQINRAAQRCRMRQHWSGVLRRLRQGSQPGPRP